jgi:hypothetical protein
MNDLELALRQLKLRAGLSFVVIAKMRTLRSQQIRHVTRGRLNVPHVVSRTPRRRDFAPLRCTPWGSACDRTTRSRI